MQENHAASIGLNVPYEWWPAASLLKGIEAAGFEWTQIPAPPASVLSDPRLCRSHANAVAAALATTALGAAIHAPDSLRAGTPYGDRAFEGLVSYTAEAGARLVVYHAADYVSDPAGEDRLLAETRSLSRLAKFAERAGVGIGIENLAPVFPGPDRLSFSPALLRTMAKRIDSPAVGICLDIGHANVVASLRRADPIELIEPALDSTVLLHIHDNFGARREAERRPELDPLRLDLHLPPGRGSIGWDRIVPYLTAHPAPRVVEVHPPHRTPPAQMLAAARSALAAQPAPASA